MSKGSIGFNSPKTAGSCLDSQRVRCCWQSRSRCHTISSSAHTSAWCSKIFLRSSVRIIWSRSACMAPSCMGMGPFNRHRASWSSRTNGLSMTGTELSATLFRLSLGGTSCSSDSSGESICVARKAGCGCCVLYLDGPGPSVGERTTCSASMIAGEKVTAACTWEGPAVQGGATAGSAWKISGTWEGPPGIGHPAGGSAWTGVSAAIIGPRLDLRGDRPPTPATPPPREGPPASLEDTGGSAWKSPGIMGRRGTPESLAARPWWATWITGGSSSTHPSSSISGCGAVMQIGATGPSETTKCMSGCKGPSTSRRDPSLHRTTERSSTTPCKWHSAVRSSRIKSPGLALTWKWGWHGSSQLTLTWKLERSWHDCSWKEVPEFKWSTMAASSMISSKNPRVATSKM